MPRHTILPLAAFVVFVGCAANFAIWLTEALDLGGNALSGDVRDGHYFVANKGRYVEVTPEVWEHSRLHTESIIVTQPVALISLGYLAWLYSRRKRDMA